MSRFLLARLHIKTLIEKPTKKRIKIALDGLVTGPEGLRIVYEQTMNRIQGQGRDRKDLAKLILMWIVHARRPLSTRGLQHALSVEPDSTEVDKDDIPSARILKSVCAGLVQVIGGSDKVDEGSQIVGLIHYTAQEYFEKTQAQWFPDAQRYITQTCVAYLCFPSLSGYCNDDQKFDKRLEAYPFYDYAAHEWGHHARTLPADPRVVAFLQQREVIQGSIQALTVDWSKRLSWEGLWSQYFPKGMNGLHLAAFFGLHHTVRELLDGLDINEVDSYHRTPLVVAGGHLKVVEVLVNTGNADVNIIDNHGRTALISAIRMRQLDVAELLIKTGNADVSIADDYGRTALRAASEGGHPKVVKLLLETENVKLNETGYRDRTVLLTACEQGHSEVVELFLKTGRVDVNMTGSHGRTALLAASEGGYSKVVHLLLETGNVNVNAVDQYGQTALFIAIERDHLNVVKLLIASGNVDFNVVDQYGRTALSAASDRGNSEVVELLLKTENIDVNAVDHEGGTALLCAARRLHLDVVELLLHTGNANINVIDKKGRTPLWWAVKGNKADVVKLLVEMEGVDVNRPCRSGKLPLNLAAVNSNLDVVRLLVTTGKADVNRKDKNGRTALIHATLMEAESIVRFLLDSGADTGIIDTMGYSAFDFARLLRLKSIEDLLKSKVTSLGEATQVQSRTE